MDLKDKSTPITNVIGVSSLCFQFTQEYRALCLARPSTATVVQWHKDILGKQERCFTGECRMWVWSGDDWRVFVSNRKGICFEVREGVTSEAAMSAWNDYRTKLGVLLEWDLFGEDRVDECLLIESLLKKLREQEEALKTGFVCPHCKTVPVRVAYQGYYDSFDSWECDCGDGDVPVSHTFKGQYG